jgi:hypothetical protein
MNLSKCLHQFYVVIARLILRKNLFKLSNESIEGLYAAPLKVCYRLANNIPHQSTIFGFPALEDLC